MNEVRPPASSFARAKLASELWMSESEKTSHLASFAYRQNWRRTADRFKSLKYNFSVRPNSGRLQDRYLSYGK